eukprot:6261381-Karenia_brevis.AAC.1
MGWYPPQVNAGDSYTPPQWTDAPRLPQELWPQDITATICHPLYRYGGRMSIKQQYKGNQSRRKMNVHSRLVKSP